MRHVALYCRISRKTKTGLIESVEVQERWGRDYAGTAWPGQPIVVYSDDAVTAADEDVWRPGFDKLRTAVRDGEVSHIWSVAQDRLQRVEVGWFTFAAELVSAGIDEVHTRNDGLVRVGDDIAGIKTYVIVPEQADAIRQAAEWVLAGWSLASVAAKLAEQGMKGPHRVKVRDEDGNVVLDEDGEPVTRSTVLRPTLVRSMITNPTVAGKRVYRGRIVGLGNWEPILTEATWEAVRSKLSAPRRVKRADGGTYPVTERHTGFSGRKYTLTGGLACCGVCGAAMVGTDKQVGGKIGKKPYLVCHPVRGGKACVGIMLPETEQYVADELFRQLDKPQFLDSIVADDHVQRRSEIVDALAAVEAQRAELARMWGTPGSLTTAEWQAAREALNATERQLRAELAEKAPPPQVADIGRVRACWPLLDLGEKREFLRLFIDRVVINRATPGRKGFDAARVDIIWL
jgi:site-specific DNA recombinase